MGFCFSEFWVLSFDDDDDFLSSEFIGFAFVLLCSTSTSVLLQLLV